ncbi:nitronate monooxygenase [Actinopolymorpha sp. NPDC004070]|uniref:NAD(P)H-dependent flavin oxidoreductase n=1 Tax=Actinopolymorpha sp. NPDC004070 TaxID=3154548 RepID=UPI0033A5E30A
MLQTKFSRFLGLSYPIVGAPMAGPGTGRLASIVSGAGALGMVGVGSRATKEWVRAHLDAASSMGQQRWGVGVQVWALPNQPGVMDEIEIARPALVSLSFGDPSPYIDQVHRAGALAASQVNSVADARQAVDAGVDVVVVQGAEAGGHHAGRVATLPLLQGVLEAVEYDDVFVLAGGGIGTGRGLAAVLAAGADAGWIGTAFLATPEAHSPLLAKMAVLSAKETDTIHTRVFDLVGGIPWPERYPGRALRNSFARSWHPREAELTEWAEGSDPESAGKLAAVKEELTKATKAEDYDVAVVYAGQAAGLVRDERRAEEVVRSIGDDAERCMRAAAELCVPDERYLG